MPSDNTQQGTANADPFSDGTNTITPTTNIDSEPRPSLLEHNLSFLRSILCNNGDGRYEKMRFDRINDYIRGIPRAAATMSLDEQLLIFQRFEPERVQLLMYFQLKVIEAKNALNDYDKDQEKKRTGGVSSFDDEKRDKLVVALDSALLEYDKRVIYAQQILSIPKPNGRDAHSFFNIFYNYKQVTEGFFESCTSPISNLLTLNTRQDSWIYILIDDLACKSPILKRLLSTAEQTARSNNTGINVTDNTRIVYLIRIIRFLFLAISLCSPYFTTLSGAIIPFTTVLLVVGDISFHQVFVPIAAFCIIHKVIAESGSSPGYDSI